MAGRYIPPHLRAEAQKNVDPNGTSPSSKNNSASGYTDPSLRGGDRSSGRLTTKYLRLDDALYSPIEIQRHFWPEKEFYRSRGGQSTLHDSAVNPGAVSYVLLFMGAHPRWETDRIIFTKSRLELLPADPADSLKVTTEHAPHWTWNNDSSVTSHPVQDDSSETADSAAAPNALRDPIAIFAQVSFNRTAGSRTFMFVGYYRIARLEFLQPHSKALVKMLDQKWSVVGAPNGHIQKKERDVKGWEESLSLRWAVVKFDKDEQADRTTSAPKIEQVSEDGLEDAEEAVGGGRKSVNEMLRELRMSDGDTGDTESKGGWLAGRG